MPTNVKLNISETEIPGAPWTEVLASDGMTSFWYLWTGGNTVANNGKNVFMYELGKGIATSFQASLIAAVSSTYRFVEFVPKGGGGEISGVVYGTGDAIDVTDQQSQFGDFYWGAKVQLIATPELTFVCDPVISNRRIAGAT